MITIGRLARSFGLSRSTLLYYDSIGLLSPSSRNAKDYRLYSERDAERLEQICRYRRAGIALRDIGKLLDSRGSRRGVSAPLRGGDSGPEARSRR